MREKLKSEETISYMISGFCREAVENCVLLSNYVASCGNFLPTFRDNRSFPKRR